MLTFDELPQIWFLLQTGLQVQELPVAAVHGVVGQLLQATAALTTVQGGLVLLEEQRAAD